jgi:alpha-1,2-mannosyltransferase
VVRISQRLLPGGGDYRIVMLWTAVGIWIEPLRSNFDYGQINVLLVLAVLYAVYSTRWWLSGLLVGLAAGVKLTPAVSGLYFVGARRWGAVVFSAVVFVGTIAVSALVVGDQTRYYFTELLGDARRVGPIGTSFNQSWRGGISRILGHDAGYGSFVVAAIVVTAVLALLAWRAIGGAEDRLGAIVVVQLFGLLSSPISWTHHWVWLIPLMIWLLHGPLRERLGARILGWGWLALTLVGVPWLLSFAQPTIWVISRPWYLAWAGLIYGVATLVTLGWIAASRRRAG